MLKKMLSTAYCCLFFAISVNAQANKIDSSGMKILRIDPESAQGATVSQIFDEVKFIPLETTKESLFGEISQIKPVENYFVIFDWDAKSVLIFSNEGKYKGKIDGNKIEKSEDEKENSNFYGFSIVKEGSQNLIKIQKGKYDHFYDLTGKSIKKVLREKYDPNKKTPIKNSEYTYQSGWPDKNDKDSIDYNFAFFKDDKLVGKFLPYQRKRYENDAFYGTSGSNSEDFETNYFATQYYEYNIYKILPPKINLAYKIILPASISLPKNFATDPMYVGREKRSTFFSQNRNIVYGLGNIYQINNNLWFKMGMYGGGKKSSMIYNTKTNELISIADIEPDTLSSFLPITDLGFHYNFSNHGFHLFENGYFYTSYSSLAMFAFKEQSADKKAIYNEALSNYFKTETKKSNPIIIQLKPKKD